MGSTWKDTILKTMKEQTPIPRNKGNGLIETLKERQRDEQGRYVAEERDATPAD
jgi:hypothetical protein